MKQHFSRHWKSSKQPRKQRKYIANAPLHLRRKMMASNLSKELRKKYGRRSFPIIKGDNVKILRGKFRGKKGKIENVNYKRYRTIIEGILITKKDGTKIPVKIHPSNLQIVELNLEDNKRIKALERKIVRKETKKSSNKNKERENASKKTKH